ncbi:hypothetical protein Belba_3774 [Belliella baltica DSM 15883]|uniref:Uncharacterized protein n=1 Tax=Belliella baltica (strain DSM 15883 / CIP 108006 / LMG 21964 / BA134) TaxID=866536 RepID=I3ZAI9_BELBD|nr:hypothetical protein Belba_3774 [Belliella baltica DSM 15883]
MDQYSLFYFFYRVHFYLDSKKTPSNSNKKRPPETDGPLINLQVREL